MDGVHLTEASDTIGDLLERILSARFQRPEGSYSDWWFDHFAFFAHEVFLYAVAAHVRLRQFEGLAVLLSRRYVVPESPRARSRSQSFVAFRSYSRLLGQLNEAANPRRLSCEADLIKERATLAGYPLMMLMQSDVLCCLRTITHPGEYDIWPPVSVVYAEYLGTLDLFLRAEDRRFFRQLAPAIGVTDKADLVGRLTAWSEKHADRINWLFRYGDLSLESLIGLEQLDTRG